MDAVNSSTGQAAWTLSDFSRAVQLTRQTIWRLPKELQPERVRIGAKELITESPAAWLRRVRDAGGAPSRARSAREVAAAEAAT